MLNKYKYQNIWNEIECLATIICILLIVIIFIILLKSLYVTNFDTSIPSRIKYLYDITIIPLTFLLVCVAWIQLNGIQKITKYDFLMRIDNRFGSTDIIKARAIIHRFHCLAKPDGITYQKRIEIIQTMIKDAGQNFEKAEEFTYLMNLLDFLDTIAYFCNKNRINIDAADELLGNSIIFYYDVFKHWIYYRIKNTILIFIFILRK